MTDLPAIHHDPTGQRFRLRLDGQEAALTYALRAGRMVIEHTVVPEAIGGRGLAGRLVQAAFDQARAEGWRVVPECSYARVWAGRHPQYADLLAAD
ncbi:MAG: N-acetyltransferase [Xanthomonadales bacterium]|nr:N-acetyltransferase [Xanthomonadaceae bacterium]MBN8223320.1 N-acetyltransferase [Xanthomonadales bacterium]MCA0198595.1 N-acetyltransferase [Pseudomonadota bacterium]